MTSPSAGWAKFKEQNPNEFHTLLQVGDLTGLNLAASRRVATGQPTTEGPSGSGRVDRGRVGRERFSRQPVGFSLSLLGGIKYCGQKNMSIAILF